ncbi:hypothetical protein L1887_39161 [Cichorium endivia]|nr:hypothetical protein L1887_39161 [Cichorium endivia]
MLKTASKEWGYRRRFRVLDAEAGTCSPCRGWYAGHWKTAKREIEDGGAGGDDEIVENDEHGWPEKKTSVQIWVVFTGGRTQPGTTKPDERERHQYSILDCEAKREVILPSLAIFTALAFSQQLSGLPPETVFQPLLKNNLVGKGLVLTLITDFFKEYLIDNSLDDLISILKRGKMEGNLLDFFPFGKRSAEAFSERFTKAGMAPLVKYNDKKIFEVKVKEMKSTITSQISEEVDISEVIEIVKQHVKDAKLPEIEVVRILWDVLMDAVQWSGKISNKMLIWLFVSYCTFCTSGKLELELLYKVDRDGETGR